MSRDVDTSLTHRYEQYVSGALPSGRQQRFELDTAPDSDDDAFTPPGGLDSVSMDRAYRWVGPA
ncbi:hypothetical protein [Pigmentiphaga litoralis]|uniref:hypothetical protein n=1 Tax=Pigmentiphaga litoralis TaxID=516702 RepID=UPI003B43CE18